jgi:hypothetical protein
LICSQIASTKISPSSSLFFVCRLLIIFITFSSFHKCLFWNRILSPTQKSIWVSSYLLSVSLSQKSMDKRYSYWLCFSNISYISKIISFRRKSLNYLSFRYFCPKNDEKRDKYDQQRRLRFPWPYSRSIIDALRSQKYGLNHQSDVLES